MPLQRRLPKRGFSNLFRKQYSVVNVRDLDRFEPNAQVDTEALRERGLVKQVRDGVKLLGNGDISHPLQIKVHKVSRTARQKVEAAGGTVDLV